MILRNGLVVDRWNAGASDAPMVRPADIRIEGAQIAEVGPALAADGTDELDLSGAVVAPGFVCGHTHLYSVLSRGMPATDAVPPRNFHEILQKVWWKLDKQLDEASLVASARIGVLDALACGTTGLIDHHASPGFVDGSLDVIAQACESLGMRALLCYETSDRDGVSVRDAGIAENARFAHKNGDSELVAGMIGAHASFTCGDDTLDALATACSDTGTGLHIHLAEGGTDRALTSERFDRGMVAPFGSRGLLGPRSIFAHCVDLQPAELAQLLDAGTRLAHNPSSNMNNRVGFSPLWASSASAMLGTDGIGADMYREGKSAWFRGTEADASCSPAAILGMITNAGQMLGDAVGVSLGAIEPGRAADLQVLRYHCPTPLDGGNLGGHFLFGMTAAHVETTIVAGKICWHRGEVPGVDLAREHALAREQAVALWKRMSA